MKRLLAGLGATSLLGQVVVLRELSVFSFGSELAIVLGLGSWLVGTALGAALARRGEASDARGVAPMLLAWAWLPPALIVLARGLRTLVGGMPGAYLSLPAQLGAVAVLTLPAAVPAGWLFARAVRVATACGWTLAAAWAVECAGGVLGGAASTLLPGAGVGNLAQALVGGAAAAALAAWLPAPALLAATRPAGAPSTPAKTPARASAERGRRATGALFAIALAALAGSAPRLDRATTAWDHPGLLLVRDTPHARVTVEQHAGEVTVFTDGTLASSSGNTAAEEFVQLAALQVAAPRRVLVLGGAAAALPAEARRLPARELVVVEADGALLRLLQALPTDFGLTPAGAGPAPTVVAADPRAWLARGADADGFDLILVGAPEPATARDNRWYTREFFAACARQLAPGGVVACRLPDSPNVWTPARLRQLSGIHRALAEVFPQVVVMPGGSTVFLASRADLPLTADLPIARLVERAPGNCLVTPAYLAYLYANDRFADLRRRLDESEVPADTDRRPGCYRRTLRLWLSSFFPSLGWQAWPAATARRPPPALVPVLALGLAAAATAVAVRRRDKVCSGGCGKGRDKERDKGRGAAVAGTGAVGMLLEAALVVDYQVRAGSLYRDLGLLLCLFMAGLAAGGALGSRGVAERHRRYERWLLPAAALLAVALVSGWCAIPGGSRPGAALALSGAAMLVTAAAVGWTFAALARAAAPRSRERAAPLLAADLLGSGLGSLAAGLVAIPFAGAEGAALLGVAVGLGVAARPGWATDPGAAGRPRGSGH